MLSPGAAAVGAAALSALGLWAASPAVGLGWLAWPALVPAALCAVGYGGRRAGRLAVPLAYALYLELLLVPALPFGLAEGQWGDPPPLLIGGTPVFFVGLVAIPLFGALLYALRFGEPWLAGLGGRTGAAAIVVVPAAAWTALDFARSALDPGGVWGPLFVTQHDTQGAALGALGGPWLITFAIVALAYATAAAIIRFAAERPRRVVTAQGALLTVIVAIGVGAPAAAQEGKRQLRVAAVQPGYDTAEEGRPELRYFRPGTYDLAAIDTIADLAPLTRRAARRGAEVTVWPEAAIWVDPRGDRTVEGALTRLADLTGTAIVVPFFLPEKSQGATVIVTPGHGLGRTQPKQRPMWFLGEDGGNRRSPEPAPTGPLSAGTLLGVDNQAPGIARSLVAEGADLLASSTHDWEQMATHQLALSRFHARVTSAPLVRADWRYRSAIIDRDGNVVASTGEGMSRGIAVGSVQLAGEPSPYVRIGDLLGWIAVAIALFALAATSIARRARPGAPGRPQRAHAGPVAGDAAPRPPRRPRSRDLSRPDP